jgi:hypothetical protein
MSRKKFLNKALWRYVHTYKCMHKTTDEQMSWSNPGWQDFLMSGDGLLFGEVLWRLQKYKTSPNFWLLFSTVKVTHKFREKNELVYILGYL